MPALPFTLLLYHAGRAGARRAGKFSEGKKIQGVTPCMYKKRAFARPCFIQMINHYFYRLFFVLYCLLYQKSLRPLYHYH